MAFVQYWASFLLSLTGAGLSLKMPYADLDENLWPWMPRLLFVFNFTLFLWPSITKYTNTAAFPKNRYSNGGFNVAKVSLLCGRQLLGNHFFNLYLCQSYTSPQPHGRFREWIRTNPTRTSTWGWSRGLCWGLRDIGEKETDDPHLISSLLTRLEPLYRLISQF